MVLLVLAACGGEGNAEESTNNKKSSAYVQGITDTEILVGTTGPQTGPVAEYDKVRKGIQAYFNYVNDNGGVKGRKLKLIAYDDQYQPAKAVQGMQRLIEEEKVFGIIFPVGTSTFSATEELLKESKIPVVGIGTGATKFVDPISPNIFGMQFNYANEAKLMVDYIVNQLGAKKIAIAYQNDDFGIETLEAALSTIKKLDGVKVEKEVSFLSIDQDYSAQAQQLVQAKPDAILMLATPVPAAALRQEMYKLGATDIPFVVSLTGGQDKNQFNLAGKDVWEGVITAMPFASYESSDHADIDKYTEQIKKDFTEEDLGALTQSAWGTAQVFVEGLNRVEGDLTWESYIKALETLENWEGSIFDSITYTSENHYGNTTLRMVEAKNGNLEPIGGPVHYDPSTGKVTYK
ncbi:ABC transporter substrate-binding protein [Psychrobacillus sp. OK032]|uniref:ABC transporter substrate-binding protein n=1 Tax=Psychrobacillus sp. OK032 TaxID=1884358 RepID=UPI0008CF5C42|nr:ABC transporter substrate-binding protein [Psychrobacillus sp. OK032]SER86777.1 amino acid/amide ABC transporter substrate-binding protein, HAAT family [Psychrobacillus sp. OK032]